MEEIKHEHAVQSEGRDVAYASRVWDAGAAAGNVERQQTCACGATRWAAINGSHIATTDWTPIAYAVVHAVTHTVESTHSTFDAAGEAVRGIDRRAAYVARTHRQVGDRLPLGERRRVWE